MTGLRSFSNREIALEILRRARNKLASSEPSFLERLPRESLPSPIHDDHREPFFIHIHLPKTGGSTFNRILEKNFRLDSYAPHGMPTGYEQFAGRFIFLFDKFSNEQVKRFIEVHTTINCVASHNFNAILPYRNTTRKIIAFAFIRDPVDKFFSTYFHLRFFGGNFVEANKSIDEYIDYRLSTLQPNEGISFFLRLLTGEETEGSFEYIESLMECERLYLFDTYRMKEGCEILKGKFPGYFKDISFKVENVSKKDQVVSEEQRRRVRERISHYDIRLLDLANKKLEKLLRS